MKRVWYGLLAVVLLAGAGAAGYKQFYAARNRNGVNPWHTMLIRRGDITLVVNSTGTVQPVLSVQVGAFVSGPVEKVIVDFNDRVKRARCWRRSIRGPIRPPSPTPTPLWPTAGRTWSAFRPCWAARRNEKRGLTLQGMNKGAIAETDLDQ